MKVTNLADYFLAFPHCYSYWYSIFILDRIVLGLSHACSDGTVRMTEIMQLGNYTQMRVAVTRARSVSFNDTSQLAR